MMTAGSEVFLKSFWYGKTRDVGAMISRGIDALSA